VANLGVADLCEPPEIAGAGFINFRLRPAFLSRILGEVPDAPDRHGDRMGLPRTPHPRTVVVDLSSPNLAKEMHVGHLRSTVIGDCVARLLEFDGHEVHRENHVGDWGTQFGMLLTHLRSVRPDVAARPDELVIGDLESFYVEAKARFDADEAFRKEARDTVVALQSGEPEARRIWRAFCDESLRHCHALYRRLGVRLIDRGESFYTDLMTDVVTRLEKRMAQSDDGFVAISQGALCLFLEGFQTREGDALPLIVRKTDGGFNYATSDLATILHRVEHLGAKRIVYVVGISQKQHFEMVFAAARRAGWVGDDVSMVHLGFGNVLAATGKPFKTREGGTVKLKDLLDEAVARARRVVEAQEGADATSTLTPAQIDEIAETVGLAAVKYFDLSHSLTSDYRFDLDHILAMEGNTAPYMLYAFARIQSIGRKAGVDSETRSQGATIMLDHPAEIALAKKLVRFAETMEAAVADLRPNLLTDYLYDLAKTFSRFYDKKLGVRVIDATPDAVRASRLRLCGLTARTLRLGLCLLGINTVEQM
jgi:arginyl-tRNA synthetase